MPYVLEYTSRHYQHRRSRARSAVSTVAVVVFGGALFGLYAIAASRQPTFGDIVEKGFEDKSGIAPIQVDSYQTLANKAFKLERQWNEAVARQAEFMPYLRHLWSAVPLTNVLSDAVALLADPGPDLPADLLAPQFLSLAFTDGPADWTGPDADYLHSLRLTLRWRTVTGHDEDTAARAAFALSNLFARAASPAIASNPPVSRVTFPEGNCAGLDVVAEYDFPTVRRMPVSANLAKAIEALSTFHKEAVETEIYPAKDPSVKPTLQSAFTDLDDRRARPVPFAEAMDPGAWIATAGLSKWTGVSTDIAAAKRTVEEWNRRVHGRYPWERGLQRRLMASPNFLPPARLQEFVNGLPDPGRLKATVEAFNEKSSGLTNSLATSSFSDYDENVFSPEDIHPTGNLLDVAWGTTLVPTNRLLVTERPGEKLVVRHPRPKASGGVHLVLPDPVVPGIVSTNRFAFAEWRYDFTSTNAPAALPDIASGLAGFVGCGIGYEPAAIEANLGPTGVSRLVVTGLIPVQFPQEK